MHKINGILIDPEERTVTDVEVGYSLEEWYKLLDCDSVEFAFLSLKEGDVQMICDEEGLYTDKAQFTFSSVDYQQFAGKALIVDFEEAMARGTMYRPFEAHAREAACNLFKTQEGM